nr:MAG TPA: hypothetical protein [Caudoviricetes sp.]
MLSISSCPPIFIVPVGQWSFFIILREDYA